MIFGGPETVVAALRTLERTAGITNLICWMNFGGMPQDAVRRSMGLFAEEVMPAIRDRGRPGTRRHGVACDGRTSAAARSAPACLSDIATKVLPRHGVCNDKLLRARHIPQRSAVRRTRGGEGQCPR